MEERYVIWHIKGGLGKNIAATSLISDVKKKYSDRKLIMVVSYPEIFLNHPDIDRVLDGNKLSYFYEDYIENKDIILFNQEPYDTIGHITKQKHLIENWCDILEINYTHQQPTIYFNYSQKSLINKWINPKPILLLQTTGGPTMSFNNIPQSQYEWTRDIPIEISSNIVKQYSSRYHIIHLTPPRGYVLEGVERIDQELPKSEIFALIASSTKRILIDSSLQHMSSALQLPSSVFWIGTSPKVFGYKIHNNIVAHKPKRANQLINSYLFDYQFDNNTYECPYMSVEDMFDIKEVMKKLGD